jgi:hypothetical protein
MSRTNHASARSQSVAEYELLWALQRIFPAPLVDLRNLAARFASPAPARDNVAREDAAPRRSPERLAQIEAVKQRLGALSAADKRALDLAELKVHASRQLDGRERADALNAWANRWHLHALLGLAPAIIEYWIKRPKDADRFWFPTIRPSLPQLSMPSAADPVDLAALAALAEAHSDGSDSPECEPLNDLASRPLLAHPDFETKDEFLERAVEHYQARFETLRVLPTHRRRKLRRHAEWYVRHHIEGLPVERVAETAQTARTTPEETTITKGIREFADVLNPQRPRK